MGERAKLSTTMIQMRAVEVCTLGWQGLWQRWTVRAWSPLGQRRSERRVGGLHRAGLC